MTNVAYCSNESLFYAAEEIGHHLQKYSPLQNISLKVYVIAYMKYVNCKGHQRVLMVDIQVEWCIASVKNGCFHCTVETLNDHQWLYSIL